MVLVPVCALQAKSNAGRPIELWAKTTDTSCLSCTLGIAVRDLRSRRWCRCTVFALSGRSRFGVGGSEPLLRSHHKRLDNTPPKRVLRALPLLSRSYDLPHHSALGCVHSLDHRRGGGRNSVYVMSGEIHDVLRGSVCVFLVPTGLVCRYG